MPLLRFGFGRDRGNCQSGGYLATYPFISAPQFLGVVFWDSFDASVWSVLIGGMLFATYLVGIFLAKKTLQMYKVAKARRT